MNSTLDKRFEDGLAALPEGYTTGYFSGSRWGATKKLSVDGKRTWLFAEELGGTRIVSFNAYRLLNGGLVVKPCEMSSETIAQFVVGYLVDDAPSCAS